MPGLNQMSSISSGGASVITLQFDLDLSLDVAEQEVQAAINAAGNLLPADLPAPPIYAKVNPGRRADPDPGADLEDPAADRRSRTWPTRGSAQKISQLAGVGLVSISGGQRPAVRIQANTAGAGRLRPQHRRSAHRPSATPTPTRPRAASTGRRAPTRSTPTTSCRAPTTTRTSSSPTRTARRSGCRTSPTSSTARRTPSSAPG